MLPGNDYVARIIDSFDSELECFFSTKFRPGENSLRKLQISKTATSFSLVSVSPCGPPILGQTHQMLLSFWKSTRRNHVQLDDIRNFRGCSGRLDAAGDGDIQSFATNKAETKRRYDTGSNHMKLFADASPALFVCNSTLVSALMSQNIVAQRRYSSGNPIARRGIVVSIGSANTDDQYYDNHHTDPYSDRPSDVIGPGNSFGNNPLSNIQPIPQRRRIRNASERYRRLYSNPQRPQDQQLRSNFDCYSSNYNQHIASRTQMTSDTSRHQHQSHPRRTTTAENIVYQNAVEQEASNTFSTQHLPDTSISRIYSNDFAHQASEALTTPTFPGRWGVDPKTISQPSSTEDYELRSFNAYSQMHQEYEESRDLDHTRNHDSDQTFFMHQGRNPHQSAGIKRFQKPENDDRDWLLDPGQGENDLFADTSGILDYGGLDDFSDSKPQGRETPKPILADSDSQFQQQRLQSSLFHAAESTHMGGRAEREFDNDLFVQEQQNLPSKPQLNLAIPLNSLTRRLSDITNESNKLGEPSLGSNDSGLSRFKRRRGEKSSVTDFTTTPLRHLDSTETIFEHAIDHQIMKPSTGTLRFFNDEAEVDILGTPLNGSMAPKREQFLGSIETLQTRNRDDVTVHERASKCKNNQHGNNDTGGAKWRGTAPSSPDTDFLKDTSFGDESVWNFFR
eukprot:jgi/Psemu1/2855/gm1.2855_g